MMLNRKYGFLSNGLSLLFKKKPLQIDEADFFTGCLNSGNKTFVYKMYIQHVVRPTGHYYYVSRQ